MLRTVLIPRPAQKIRRFWTGFSGDINWFYSHIVPDLAEFQIPGLLCWVSLWVRHGDCLPRACTKNCEIRGKAVESILCVAGKNRIAVSALRMAMTTKNLRIVALPNSDDLGLDTWQPSLVKEARDSSVPIVDLEHLYDLPHLVFISLEYNQIIRPARFQSRRLYNIHFSLLPDYRGTSTSVWPLLQGASHTGVTLHEIDEGIDTGNVLSQIRIRLTKSTTARDLYELYQDAALNLFRKNLKYLLAGHTNARPQPEALGSYFSRQQFEQLSREINFAQPASKVRDFVRALYFPEYQTAVFRGLTVSKATPTRQPVDSRPGTVLRQSSNSITVACSDFYVELVTSPSAPISSVFK